MPDTSVILDHACHSFFLTLISLRTGVNYPTITQDQVSPTMLRAAFFCHLMNTPQKRTVQTKPTLPITQPTPLQGMMTFL